VIDRPLDGAQADNAALRPQVSGTPVDRAASAVSHARVALTRVVLGYAASTNTRRKDPDMPRTKGALNRTPREKAKDTKNADQKRKLREQKKRLKEENAKLKARLRAQRKAK
jgi:hypothetical protein